MIAMALINHPRLLIADEPTSALDVTSSTDSRPHSRPATQHGMSVLLITHDLGVIAEMAMKSSSCTPAVSSNAPAPRELFSNPRHAYTRGLLASIPGSTAPPALPAGIEESFRLSTKCRAAAASVPAIRRRRPAAHRGAPTLRRNRSRPLARKLSALRRRLISTRTIHLHFHRPAPNVRARSQTLNT
jgi:ABC-type dipeptide/oligopeptide/nickel transport system ATPase component